MYVPSNRNHLQRASNILGSLILLAVSVMFGRVAYVGYPKEWVGSIVFGVLAVILALGAIVLYLTDTTRRQATE